MSKIWQKTVYNQPLSFFLMTHWSALFSRHNLTQMTKVGMNEHDFLISWLDKRGRKQHLYFKFFLTIQTQIHSKNTHLCCEHICLSLDVKSRNRRVICVLFSNSIRSASIATAMCVFLTQCLYPVELSVRDYQLILTIAAGGMRANHRRPEDLTTVISGQPLPFHVHIWQ